MWKVCQLFKSNFNSSTSNVQQKLRGDDRVEWKRKETLRRTKTAWKILKFIINDCNYYYCLGMCLNSNSHEIADCIRDDYFVDDCVESQPDDYYLNRGKRVEFKRNHNSWIIFHPLLLWKQLFFEVKLYIRRRMNRFTRAEGRELSGRCKDGGIVFCSGYCKNSLAVGMQIHKRKSIKIKYRIKSIKSAHKFFRA